MTLILPAELFTLDQIAALENALGTGRLLQLFQRFFDDMAGSLEKLEAARTRGDGAEIAAISHAAKGVAANLGAAAIAGAAAEIETAAKNGILEQISFAEMSRAIAVTRQAIAEQFPRDK